MSIISSFGNLFDRTLNPAFANYTASNDVFEVDEHDTNPNIKTRHLRVEQAGAAFVSFNYMLVKGMGDITEKRSSLFEDYDCDVLVTNDKRMRAKTKAVYSFLGVNTKVVSTNEYLGM